MKRERPARMEIMGLLKKNGRMTARQIGEALGITPMGARQHLTAMEKDGLVSSEFVRQKAGRPALYFHLSSASEGYFPQSYVSLALNFLHNLEELDGRDKVEEVLQLRREKLLRDYQSKMNNDPTEERLKVLTRLRDADGYMAEFQETDDAFIFTEYNCPIHCVAQEYPEVCRHELELIEEMLKHPVERVEHLIQGQKACIYKIRKEK